MQQYLIAIGSNQRHRHYGAPEQVVRAGFAALERIGSVQRRSAIITSAPLGPSRRRYANGAALLQSDLEPILLLHELKKIERGFGRRLYGARWRARLLDLDIILWSGGSLSVRSLKNRREFGAVAKQTGLQIPHPRYLKRAFVLGPLREIAPDWRDPNSGLNVKQHYARLTRPLAMPR